MTTKERIIDKAKSYFNEVSLGSTTLYSLAAEIGMSRGNLTYHFKDKDALLGAILEEMWYKINVERNKSRRLPSFENLHNEIQLYYRFQKEYAFIFLDTNVLNHPLVKSKFSKMTQETIEDNKASIAFAIKLGNMRPEPIAGLYNNIALTSWMLTFYWLSQQVVRGKANR